MQILFRVSLLHRIYADTNVSQKFCILSFEICTLAYYMGIEKGELLLYFVVPKHIEI